MHLDEGLVAFPEKLTNSVFDLAAEHVLSWALTVAKSKKNRDEIWSLCQRDNLHLWENYPLPEAKAIRVERIKMHNLDLPDHYPQFTDGCDLFLAIDWRKTPSSIAAGFRPDKDLIIVYPFHKFSALLRYPTHEYALEDYLTELRNSVEHEMRHVVQIMILPAEQSVKGYTNTQSDEYFLSPMEFDPTIASEASIFANHIKVLNEYGKKINLTKMIKQTVGILPPPIGERPVKFFTILKKYDQARYHLAIKKFVQEVNRLLIP